MSKDGPVLILTDQLSRERWRAVPPATRTNMRMKAVLLSRFRKHVFWLFLFLFMIEVILGGHKNREVFRRALGECFFIKLP
jgi:hypothetical protein